jgi:hypothetical protein
MSQLLIIILAIIRNRNLYMFDEILNGQIYRKEWRMVTASQIYKNKGKLEKTE